MKTSTIEFLIATIIISACGILAAFVVMLCWNYVMPQVFKLPTINFIQSCCLLVLGNCLIKSSNGNISQKSD
jgi:hypothetical protein